MPDGPVPDLECDIVMKGGITSGVVYPLAAKHLSEKYRFRRIGGASAGAIAAVFVAAAEYGRSGGGFNQLGELPAELGRELEFLFQPSPATKDAYDALVVVVGPKTSALKKLVRVLRSVLRPARRRTVALFVMVTGLGALVAVGVESLRGWPPDWARVVQMVVPWAMVAAIATLVASVLKVGRSSLAALEGNGFGLCDGHTSSVPGHAPLTDWMTDKVQVLSGLTSDLLTFGDLWGQEAVDRYDELVKVGKGVLDLTPLEQRELREKRIIDLEVMTTNLTLRRPYRFPFEPRVFFFCEDCFLTYFPVTVVAHMVAKSETVPDGGTTKTPIEMLCPLHRSSRVRYFPRPPDIPVVVAARLSLSFPGLISAVPLCYADYGRAEEHRRLITVWFSDGGIASNFPVHLFDTVWPSRPTFAINLQPLTEEHGPQLTYLAALNGPRSHSITSMVGFVQSILDTMQNWVDTTQLVLPAYRKRVAELRLADHEGGMNLTMPEPVITEISRRGADAAAHLDSFDLVDHQEKRFKTSMAMIDLLLTDLGASAAAGFTGVIDGTTPHDRVQAARDLLGLAADWEGKEHPATVKGDLPKPLPDLRMMPRQ